MQGYVDRVCAEIRDARSVTRNLGATLDRLADSIYFGGGTPSLLSAGQFRQIFATLRSEFTLTSEAEITLECAPGQLSNETLEELLRQGMNRISFGVQSFVDKESAAVGRLHTEQQCRAEIARLRAAGVSEINVDLIAGLPHQTEQSWRYSLEQVIASDVPHASVYMLEVDDESRLGKEMLANGTRYHASAVPSEDDAAAWYQLACEAFDSAGLQQYEISNFARSGHASQHNLKYWKRQPYIGFGLDAHSMLRADTKDVRSANTDDLDTYLGNAGEAGPFEIVQKNKDSFRVEPDIVGRDEAFEESLFLGLRLNEGVTLNNLRDEFGDALLEDVMPALLDVRDAGLLEMDSGLIRLTARGRMVSNEVFSRLLLASAA
jgi:oxygen-independent coproporphyrinogen-3 oxidase